MKKSDDNLVMKQGVDLQEAISHLPGWVQEKKFIPDIAEQLFKTHVKKSIRFVNLPSNEEKPQHTFLIILDEAVCLWFFKKTDTFVYDGWELGDYTKAWLDYTIF